MAGLLLAGPAIADPQPPKKVSEADRLFEEGRVFAKAGKFVEACARFTKSFEIDHALGTELNLADCHEKLGHRRIAWRLFLAAADESERSDDTQRTAFARQRANALASQLTEVVINVAQPTATGLAISVAGHIVEPAPVIRDRTDPGPIEVVAMLPGRPTFVARIKGAAGASLAVDVPAFGAPIVAPSPAMVERRRKSHVYLAYGLGAAGGVTAIIGLVVGLKARGDYDATVDSASCHHVSGGYLCTDAADQRIADAQRLADLGTGFAIGGGVLLAGAAVVFFTAPRDRIVIAPTVNAEQVGVVARGSF
jgi:hypothetical protein